MASFYISLHCKKEVGPYQRVTVDLPDRKEQVTFASGCPAVDMMRMLRWIFSQEVWDLEQYPAMYSSSVDHFTMDHDGYHWEEVAELLGTAILLKDGQSFAELKEYVKKNFPAEGEPKVMGSRHT